MEYILRDKITYNIEGTFKTYNEAMSSKLKLSERLYKEIYNILYVEFPNEKEEDIKQTAESFHKDAISRFEIITQ